MENQKYISDLPKIRDFAEYTLSYDADKEKAKKFHNAVNYFTSQFVTNHTLQDLIFNRGSGMVDEQRPETWKGYSSAFNGNRASVHLSALEHMMHIATTPKLIEVQEPQIMLPDDETKFVMGGFDARTIEQLQTNWMTNPINTTIREYHAKLMEATREYFNKFMVSGIDKIRKNFVDPEYKEDYALVEKAKEVFNPESFTELDNAYYSLTSPVAKSV